MECPTFRHPRNYKTRPAPWLYRYNVYVLKHNTMKANKTLKATAAILGIVAAVYILNACIRLACVVLYLTITRGELPQSPLF